MRGVPGRITSQVKSFMMGGRVLLSVGCVLLSAASAVAAERVQLAGPETPSSDVEEVLVRTQAELGSVGFSVVRCPLEEVAGLCAPRASTGRLEVKEDEEQSRRVVLRAFAQGEMAPLTQELELGQRGVSAEVAAIRAVELLRAMLLLSLREGNLRPEEGGSVQRFTAWQVDEPDAEPAPPPRQEPESALVVPEVHKEQGAGWVWAAGLGPSVSLPGARVRPGWGGEFFVDAGYRSIYFGAAFDAALAPSVVQRPEGKTEISSIAAVLRLGWTAPCGDKWQCRIGPHLGLLQFDFQANENSLSRGSDARHLTYLLGGDATVARYFLRGFGAFFRLRLGLTGDAARLELSDPVVLGRPVSGLSLGVIFR